MSATWQPLPPAELARELADLPAAWFLAGGWAIEAFVGGSWREHGDTDVVVSRGDQAVAQRYLAQRGWRLHAAVKPHGLRPWAAGDWLPVGVHDIWCRRADVEPWRFQLMLIEATDTDWVFRRNPAIRGPWADLGWRDAAGVPWLDPAVQLLFKGAVTTNRPKDQADFEACRPRLDPARRARLADWLAGHGPDDHPWRTALAPDWPIDLDIAEVGDPGELEPLTSISVGEGHGFLARATAKWRAGERRFDQPGERLLVARVGGRPVACAGLSVDPYQAPPGNLRLRHVYTEPAHRGRGLATLLVRRIVGHAVGHCRRVRLLALNPAAARLYERLGFAPVSGEERCSHALDTLRGPTE